MKKTLYSSVLFIILLALTTCIKWYDTPKNISTIIESNGKSVEPKQNKILIDRNTEIVSSHVNDSINTGIKKVAQYELTITGTKVDSIDVGSIIINNSGDLKAYLVTKIISLKSGSKANNLSSVVVRAIEATLDLVFKDGVIIKFNSKENRAKKNSTYNDKIYGFELKKDPDESVTTEQGKVENWTGYSSSSSDDDGLKMNLTYEHTFDGVKYANTQTGASFSFKFNGNIRVNPSYDFILDYGSELHKTSEAYINDYFLSTCSRSAMDIFGPSMNIGKLKRIKAISYIDFDYALNFEFIAEGKLNGSLVKVPLAKPKSVFVAGPVAITEVTNVLLEIDVSISAAGKGSYFFKKENDLTFGFDLQPSNISTINNSDLKYVREVITRHEEGFAGILEIKLAAGIKLIVQHESYVYGILGPQVKAGGFVEASVNQWISAANQMSGWEKSINAGIFGDASLDLSFFHFDKTTWKIFKSEELKSELNLYKSPSKVTILDGNNQTGTINSQLLNPLSVRVYDSRNVIVDEKVPVYFSGSDLSGYHGTASPSVVLSSSGIAQTNWTLGNQIGQQKLLAYLKSQDGGQTGKSAEFSATGININSPPATPSHPSPTTGATGISISPTLSWSCTDPNNDALTYDVYFGITNSPTTLIASGQVMKSITRSGLSNNTPYYWKVVAKDSKGATTSGPVWAFTTVNESINNPPAIPSNPIPATGATGLSTSLTLNWNCSDPDGDALTYDVYFGTTSNPTTLISTGQTSRSISRSGLSNSTPYYWKVLAKDSKGLISSGPAWSFTTVGMIWDPAIPSNPNPADNSTVKSTQNTQNVTLSWNCSDPTGDPLTYDVYFVKGSGSEVLVAERINTKSFTISVVPYASYRWHIVAYDNHSNISMSPTWRFTTSALLAFTISPASGTTSTLFTFNASSSIPSSWPYQWDFESDGIWDTDFSISPVTHQYTSSGTKTVSVRSKAYTITGQIVYNGPVQRTVNVTSSTFPTLSSANGSVANLVLVSGTIYKGDVTCNVIIANYQSGTSVEVNISGATIITLTHTGNGSFTGSKTGVTILKDNINGVYEGIVLLKLNGSTIGTGNINLL